MYKSDNYLTCLGILIIILMMFTIIFTKKEQFLSKPRASCKCDNCQCDNCQCGNI